MEKRMRHAALGFAMLMLLCMLMTAGHALAVSFSPDAALETAIRQAIFSLAHDDEGGEYLVEGHVVLGEEREESAVRVYVNAMCMDYGFMDGVFTDTGSGYAMPLALSFARSGDSYELKEIVQPEDGENYGRSIEAMMPAACYERLYASPEADRAEQARQMHEQAQAYLDSIGRAEPVQDWRERDLDLADMLVTASNLTIGFSPPYPLWVTTLERVEGGVRYVYERTWTPEPDAPSGYTYTTPGGIALLCDGRPGVQTLTKTRASDGEVVETITIRAELFELRVTLADGAGTAEYRFEFDGETYHRTKIERTGECEASYPMFEASCGWLPE